MSYTIRRSDGTTLTAVADQTIDTTSTSLSLVGRGAVNYGSAFAENFVYLLENFASSAAPSKPMTGQLWYDTVNTAMKYFDGTQWKQLGTGGGTGTTGSLSGGGLTIGGSPTGSNRTAGATGATLVWGNATTTVAVILSEGRIIAIGCMESIPNSELSATVSIDGKDYALKSRFPNGISAGFTLATDSAGYVMAGTSTSAYYADLAERYESDMALEPGDVVELGGTKEIRKTTRRHSTDVFGVVSTQPGLMLNSNAGDDATHPYVALAGRVPCKVSGPVRKGQRLVASATPGIAEGAHGDEPNFSIIGRAVADKTDAGVGLVEIVVGGVK